MKRNLPATVIPLLTALSIAAFIAGCNTTVNKSIVSGNVNQSVEKPKNSPKVLSSSEMRKIKPNELGKVLILEYHDVSGKEGRWSKYYGSFRSDLETLYKAGYRPVSLRDFVTNRIDVPAGTSPVVITFDDGTEGQFRYIDGKDGPKVDPNCAVGIMQDFHSKHPDWKMAATFFVYYPTPFRQRQYVEQKLRTIISLGMDIGNHTYTHVNLHTLQDMQAEKEMALSVKEAKRYVPNAIVDAIALPYGMSPNNKALLKSGDYEGQRYENIAALLVGAEPAPSPASKDFSPYRLPRVQAIQSELDKWLGYFKKHPEKRYISDGDPRTVAIPQALKSGLDESNLKDKKVRIY